MSHISAVVVGGGVVGLAIGKRLVEQGLSIVVVERHRMVGSENSSRNSEVLHAGLYYPPASLKAAVCNIGKQQLRAYIHDRQIPYQECGKLIVSRPNCPADEEKLQLLHHNALLCGLKEGVDISWVSETEVRDLEPVLQTGRALLSHKTAIFSSHALLEQLAMDCENEYGDIVYGCAAKSARVVSRHCSADGASTTGGQRFEVDTSQGKITCDYLVNAAGLNAPFFASRIQGFPQTSLPSSLYFAKGNYWRMTGSTLGQRPPLRHLIYPLPEQGGLGVHATLDLAGQVRFGPDVQWLAPTVSSAAMDADMRLQHRSDVEFFPTFDPDCSESAREAFAQAVQQYWPTVQATDLQSDCAGIRPKLCGPGAAADFLIAGPVQHGLSNLVCLFGIESPGLTSCMAIADIVSKKLRE